MTIEDAALSKLIHDVNSKCASLKSAAKMLRDAGEEERGEFLTLMKEQAASLLRSLNEMGR